MSWLDNLDKPVKDHDGPWYTDPGVIAVGVLSVATLLVVIVSYLRVPS